jgi:hypothetical protein
VWDDAELLEGEEVTVDLSSWRVDRWQTAGIKSTIDYRSISVEVRKICMKSSKFVGAAVGGWRADSWRIMIYLRRTASPRRPLRRSITSIFFEK